MYIDIRPVNIKKQLIFLNDIYIAIIVQRAFWTEFCEFNFVMPHHQTFRGHCLSHNLGHAFQASQSISSLHPSIWRSVSAFVTHWGSSKHTFAQSDTLPSFAPTPVIFDRLIYDISYSVFSLKALTYFDNIVKWGNSLSIDFSGRFFQFFFNRFSSFLLSGIS